MGGCFKRSASDSPDDDGRNREDHGSVAAPTGEPAVLHSLDLPCGDPHERGLLKGSLGVQVTDSRLIAQQEASP